MARLHVEFQQRYGMTPADAPEAADLLAGMSGRRPDMKRETDPILADMRAALTRIEARLTEMAEGDRRPRH
jgi:hypothetical protein